MYKGLQQKSQLSDESCRLVYDAECWLCATIQSKLERMRRGQAGVNIRFVPYQSEESWKALGHDSRPGRPQSAFLIKPSGEVLCGLEAFLPLVSDLPGGNVLLWVLRFPLVRSLAEWSYRIVARHRYRWFGEITST